MVEGCNFSHACYFFLDEIGGVRDLYAIGLPAVSPMVLEYNHLLNPQHLVLGQCQGLPESMLISVLPWKLVQTFLLVWRP